MNNVIKGFELSGVNTTLKLPVGAKVISAKTQKGGVYIWVMLDPDLPFEVERTFTMIGTGQTFKRGMFLYVSTVSLFAQSLILHVFEVIKHE